MCTGHIVPFWTKRRPDGAEQNHETSFVLATLQLRLSFGLLTAKGWSCHRDVGIRLTWVWTVAPRQTTGLSTQSPILTLKQKPQEVLGQGESATKSGTVVWELQGRCNLGTWLREEPPPAPAIPSLCHIPTMTQGCQTLTSHALTPSRFTTQVSKLLQSEI